MARVCIVRARFGQWAVIAAGSPRAASIARYENSATNWREMATSCPLSLHMRASQLA